MSDVEPDNLPEEIAAQIQQQAEQSQLSLLPEIVAEFRETVVISAAESATDAVPTAVAAGPSPSASAESGQTGIGYFGQCYSQEGNAAN